MTARSNTIALTIILLLSIASTFFWLFEITKIVGWDGFYWVDGLTYSPHVTTLIAAITYITPFTFSRQIKFINCISSILILYVANILFFEAGKQLCYLLYCVYCSWSINEIYRIILVAFILYVILGFIYWFVTNKLVKKNIKINMLVFTFFMVLAIPLSLLTININSGLGSITGWIEAVKMGYPVFWTTLMLGISGMMITNQKTVKSS